MKRISCDLPLPKSYRDLEAYPPRNIIYRGPCTTVALIAPNIVLKWAPNNGAEEIHALRFAQRHGFPVPQVIYHPPLRGQVQYFCMNRCRGVPLEEVIDTMSVAELNDVADQLKSLLIRMSSIKSKFISSVNGGPLHNFFYPPSIEPNTSFSSVGEFYDYYREKLRYCSVDDWLETFFKRLPRNDTIHFVHGDVKPPNIMVDGSTITSIIDWATAGFYPSHWEHCRMHRYQSPGWTHILERISPFEARKTEIIAAMELMSMIVHNF